MHKFINIQNLDVVLQLGEGQYIEFKESLDKSFAKEIVANLLIHREYTNAYPASFIIYRDKVNCKNANKPHTCGQLYPDSFEPFPKNPHIAQIFTQMGRSEELGTGIRNVYKYSKAYTGIDKIVFREEDIFVVQVPLSETIIPNKIYNDELNDELNTGQKKVFKYICNTQGKMAKHISNDLKMPFGTVDRHIRYLLSINLIERRGSKKTGGYYIVNDDK